MAETGSSSTQQDLAQILQITYTEEEWQSILEDKDINVRDPILPIFDLHKAMQNILTHNA